MMHIKDFNEQVYVEDLIPPASGVTTQTTAYINAGLYERVVFVISAGTLAVAATVDAQVVQATDSGGTGSKNVTGAAITQLTDTDDDKFVSIEVQSDQLDIANDFDYVAVTVTVSGTADLAVYVLGLNPRHVPVTQPAAYDEAVQVAG